MTGAGDTNEGGGTNPWETGVFRFNTGITTCCVASAPEVCFLGEQIGIAKAQQGPAYLVAASSFRPARCY